MCITLSDLFSFEAKIYETGLDVIALAKFYAKSYSQVLLRIGEVLQRKRFLYGALYEVDSQTGKNWVVTYWTGSWNEERPDANVYGLGKLFPRKGQLVAPGSLVDMTILGRKPHLVERITILDEIEDDGLALSSSNQW